MFRNKSFNVKMVDDRLTAAPEEERNVVENVLAAQAYAGIAKVFIADVASTVVVSVTTVIAVKTLSNVINLGAKALFR